MVYSSWSGNVGLTHFLMKHLERSGNEASRAKWEPEKKDPLRRSFFSYRPSAGAAPRSVLTQQKCCFAPKMFAQKCPSPLVPANQNIQRYQHTTTTKNNTTTTQNRLDRQGMASLQSNLTFSFKHHLTGEAWPVCRAIQPFHSNTT